MGAQTGIAWADSTLNFWIGCRKVSPGCTHCYAEKLVRDRMGRVFTEVRRTTPENWAKAYKWDREAAASGERRFVFTCSLSDFFIEEADEWRADAWKVVRDTSHLTWLVLTKRPERIAEHLPGDWGEGYPNTWLGVSGETMAHIEARAPYLAQLPAALRFLSAEPWLETNPRSALHPNGDSPDFYIATLGVFDWVILGGESGAACRPMNAESARLVRDACASLRIPFFFKQLGGHPDKRSHEKAVLDGRTWTEVPVPCQTTEAPT